MSIEYNVKLVSREMQLNHIKSCTTKDFTHGVHRNIIVPWFAV